MPGNGTMQRGESTPVKPPREGMAEPWGKGLSGNPSGRPKGSRHKITERFLKKLAKDFQQHGEQVIETVRIKHPDKYLTIVASCMPKDYNVDLNVSDIPVLIADLRGFQGKRVIELDPLDGELEE